VKHSSKKELAGQQWRIMLVIPAARQVEMGRIVVEGQPEQKVGKAPSQSISWVWWHVPVVPVTREATGRRTEGENWPREKNLRLYLTSN
jgi:hypothetical protein